MRNIKKEFNLFALKRAGFWRRLAAFLIDLMVIYLATLPLQALLAKEIGIKDSMDLNSIKSIISNPAIFEESRVLFIIVMASISLLAMLYWCVMEYLLKQSIGKMLMKIQVKSQTGELRIWQVIVRNITKASSTTSLSILLLVDVIYMFFNKNQRLSEMLSKTEVLIK